jgi:hypothetical protein
MKKCLLLWALLLVLTLAAFPTGAQESEDPVTLLVEAGYDNYFRVDYWLPVRVQIRNEGAAINGRITVRPESSGRAVTTAYSSPIELPTGSEKTSFLYIQASSLASSILVELIDNEGVRIAEVRVGLVPIDPHDSLYMLVSGTAASNIPFNTIAAGGYIARLGRWELANFPLDVAALLALDTLVFYDVNTDEMSVGQRDALRQWLSLGGHLIVIGGPSWTQTASGIGDLLPFTPENSSNVESLGALSAFVGDTASLESPAVVTTGTVAEGARSLISTPEGLALLVRGTLGAGTVDYLSVDPGLEPLRSWAAMPNFWFALLASPAPEVGWNRGFLDFQETARAIAILPNVELLPPVSNMLLYIGAYIFLIGPVNYWLLSRIKRLGWAWFTIPLFILGFTSLAWTFGFNLRGSEVIVSRLYVIQTYPDTNIARQDQLIGLLSPRREIYTVSLPQGNFVNLLPSLDGENIFQATVNRSGAEIVQGAGFDVEDLAIDGGIFANFASFSIIESPAISGTVSSSYDETGQVLRGVLRNETAFNLEDAVILARNRFYRLEETLAAGDVFSFDSSIFTLLNEENALLLPSASPMESVFGLDLGNELRNRQATAESLVSARVVMGLPWAFDARARDIEFIELDSQEANRRRALLNAFMRDQYATGSFGDEVYLVGWSNEQHPIDVEISNSEYRAVDTSLYIVQLENRVEAAPAGEAVTILPDQFTWVIRDRAAGQTIGGLNDLTMINPAWAEVRFMPIESAVLSEVTNISLELDRSSSYGREVQISLWNWQTQEWDLLDDPRLETYEVENPAAYLGANNMVDVRISLDSDLVSSAASARIRGLRLTMTGSF